MLTKEKPLIFGVIQRKGEIVSNARNVQQVTIKPLIQSVCHKSLYRVGVYFKLPAWGYEHKTVHHGLDEFARNEDADGFHEIHVNTSVIIAFAVKVISRYLARKTS